MNSCWNTMMESEDLRLFDNTKSIFPKGSLSYERDETENKFLIQIDKVFVIIPRLESICTSSPPTEQSPKQSREIRSKQEKSNNETRKPGQTEEKTNFRVESRINLINLLPESNLGPVS